MAMRSTSYFGIYGRMVWRKFRDVTKRHPYTTNVITSALVFSCGDVLGQAFEKSSATGSASVESKKSEGVETQNSPYDWPRTLRATAYGTGISVWLQAWWGFLQNSANRFVPIGRFSKLTNVLFVVALDQAVGASILNAGYFFTVSWLTDFNFDKATQRMKECFPAQMLAHLSFWPWFSIALFYTVSAISTRLLIRNIVFAGWSATMSHRNHAAEIDEDVHENSPVSAE